MCFRPRSTFPLPLSIPRSYFLGHHKAALDSIRSRLDSISLFIECRDYRIPLSSQNTTFQELIKGKQSLVVYTKHDLGSQGLEGDIKRENALRNGDWPRPVVFSGATERNSTRSIIKAIRRLTNSGKTFTGTNVLIVGLPNVGKSTLINTIRNSFLRKGKVSLVGAQPGVTRKVGSYVKIPALNFVQGPIYIADTPGVFMPSAQNSECMLKLALCGIVKDSIIMPTILADYLLYCLNLEDPSLYGEFSTPTNEVEELLDGIALKTGRLRKGGHVDREASAWWLVQRWRAGSFGKTVLDAVPLNGRSDQDLLKTSSNAGELRQ